MGKISDIWVRLGLKKNEFDKGMDDAAKKTEQTGSKMSRMLDTAKAGWAAVGTAVVAFGRELISSTNAMSDAWANSMAAMKAGTRQFFADISATIMNNKENGNWFSRLFASPQDKAARAANITAAALAGKEMSKAFDAEFELVNSLKIQRAQITGELADLQVAMRNTALSPEARKAAAERYRALLEPLYEAEIAVRKNMLDKAVQAWLAGTGAAASVAEVTEFFSKYGTDAVGMAQKYPELARVYEQLKNDDANQVIADAITALAQAQSGLANELKMVNRTANLIKDLPLAHEIEGDIDDIDLTDIPTIEPMDWDAILGDYDNGLDAFVDKWRETQEEVARLNGMLEGAIVSAMSNGLQAVTDLMFGIEGADATQVLSAMMSPFADTAIQLGEMLVAQGIAVEAFKKSLESLQGAPAIAAGAALIAIGSAMRSGIKALANGGGAAATGSYTGGAASAADVKNYESSVTVYVEGKLRGEDIYIAGKKAMNRWSR